MCYFEIIRILLVKRIEFPFATICFLKVVRLVHSLRGSRASRMILNTFWYYFKVKENFLKEELRVNKLSNLKREEKYSRKF